MPKSRHRKPLKRRKPRGRSSRAVRYVNARDLRDTHILDTSAWNQLYDDPRREQLVQVLQMKIVIPTTLAISEISAEPNEERRHGLLMLVKRVGRDNRPL